MRIFTPATASYFAQRADFHGQILVWFTVRKRTTGAVEAIGFWSGADDRDFMIDGQSRTYYGASEFLSMDPIRRQLGIKTRTQRITFSAVSPVMMVLKSQYD